MHEIVYSLDIGSFASLAEREMNERNKTISSALADAAPAFMDQMTLNHS
jgi:hypothetical protein